MDLRANANLLKFLGRHAPLELDSIRKDDTENYELLRAKAVFDGSGGGISADVALTPVTRASVLRLIRTYTAEATPDVTRLLSAIERRLRQCHGAKMLGGAIAAVSGAALALIPSLGYDRGTVALWSAGFSCAGGLLTLAAGAFERSPNGLRLTAGDYQSLVNHRAELMSIERRMVADEAFPMGDAELVKLYNRSTEIADDIAKLAP
jgi:hypothetical protein